jgi:hypothetical protein
MPRAGLEPTIGIDLVTVTTHVLRPQILLPVTAKYMCGYFALGKVVQHEAKRHLHVIKTRRIYKRYNVYKY